MDTMSKAGAAGAVGTTGVVDVTGTSDTTATSDTTVTIDTTATSDTTVTIEPSILYYGTPVALLTTENEDGTFNLAPISSTWALGRTVVLGIGRESRTAANLSARRELAISLPSPGMWEAVERLAPLTGADPVPESKRAFYRHEADKFAAAGLHPRDSRTVRPPRVAECPLQLEAVVRSSAPAGSDGHFLVVECEVVRVHAAADIVVPGTQHVDPARWSPLVYNFRHYHGLTPELGHGFRSETASQGARVRRPAP